MQPMPQFVKIFTIALILFSAGLAVMEWRSQQSQVPQPRREPLPGVGVESI